MRIRPRLVCCLAVSVSALVVQGTARAESPGAVVVLPGDGPPWAQLPDRVAAALVRASALAEASPADLAHPWVDDEGRVVFATTTAAGRGLVAARAPDVAGTHVQWRATPVARSHASLEAIKNDAIGLTDGQVRGASAVFATYVDAEHNRVVAESGAAPASLVTGLAARYGPDAIAIRLTPGADGGFPAARNNDTAPFWGGANVSAPTGGCTSGFPWLIQGAEYGVVTAGHCAPDGGSVRTPAQYVGSVSSGSRETWRAGTGTVTMTGETTYRGDVAMVSVQNGYTSGTNIYVGGVNSTSAKGIDAMWSRRTLAGDRYCTGGAFAGEICNWSVDWTQGNWKYSGTGETARNVSAATKKDHCIKAGDSGGPVYTASSTMVVAKGIISGVAGYGGGDAFAGALESSCRNVFTDIWDVYHGFPGVLRTQ